MADQPINPGVVDWSGENPGMYLKLDESGPFTCLVSFFRVVYSPHGGGHGVVILMDPQGRDANAVNAFYTDNRALAEYLKDEFVAQFAAFKGSPLLPAHPRGHQLYPFGRCPQLVDRGHSRPWHRHRAHLERARQAFFSRLQARALGDRQALYGLAVHPRAACRGHREWRPRHRQAHPARHVRDQEHHGVPGLFGDVGARLIAWQVRRMR